MTDKKLYEILTARWAIELTDRFHYIEGYSLPMDLYHACDAASHECFGGFFVTVYGNLYLRCYLPHSECDIGESKAFYGARPKDGFKGWMPR